MTKHDLRETLHANHETCEIFALYDLLECETQDDFDMEKFCAIESIRFEIYHLQRIIDALSELAYEEVSE